VDAGVDLLERGCSPTMDGLIALDALRSHGKGGLSPVGVCLDPQKAALAEVLQVWDADLDGRRESATQDLIAAKRAYQEELELIPRHIARRLDERDEQLLLLGFEAWLLGVWWASTWR